MGSTTTPAPCTRPSSSGLSPWGSSPPAVATTRWPVTTGPLSGVRALDRRHPAVAPLFARECCGASRRSDSCWSLSTPSRPALRRSRSLSSCALAGSPQNSTPGGQVRPSDPLRRRRGIPYVWFGGMVAGEVKDIRTGQQVAADPSSVDAERGRPETVGRQSYAIKLRLRTARSIRFQAR